MGKRQIPTYNHILVYRGTVLGACVYIALFASRLFAGWACSIFSSIRVRFVGWLPSLKSMICCVYSNIMRTKTHGLNTHMWCMFYLNKYWGEVCIVMNPDIFAHVYPRASPATTSPSMLLLLASLVAWWSCLSTLGPSQWHWHVRCQGSSRNKGNRNTSLLSGWWLDVCIS